MPRRTTPKLEDYRWDAEWCMGCRGCSWVDHIYCSGIKYPMKCPSLYECKFDAYSAFGRQKISLALLDGSLDFTPRVLDILYKCNLCGACDVGCKRNLDFDPLMVLETLRMRAVEKGAGPIPAHQKINDNIAKTHNRYGAPHEKRTAWLPSDARVSDKPEVLYFVGCNSSYRNQEIALATVAILEAAGAGYALFPEEACCGHPVYVSGDAEAAVKQARRNIESLKISGATTLITSCAECYKTWKVDYPKILDRRTDEMGYNVLHITEFAAAKIKEGVLEPTHPVPLRATYQDSCNLARLSEDWLPWHGTRGKYGVTEPIKIYRRGTQGVYLQPREILMRIPGVEFREMLRVDVNTFCCGAGGGVADAYPDFAMHTADHRLEEAADVGAEAIIAACPYCKDNFSLAAREGGRPIEVYDITQILYHSITGKGDF